MWKDNHFLINDKLFVFQPEDGHVDDSAWENDEELVLEIDLSNGKGDPGSSKDMNLISQQLD